MTNTVTICTQSTPEGPRLSVSEGFTTTILHPDTVIAAGFLLRHDKRVMATKLLRAGNKMSLKQAVRATNFLEDVQANKVRHYMVVDSIPESGLPTTQQLAASLVGLSEQRTTNFSAQSAAADATAQEREVVELFVGTLTELFAAAAGINPEAEKSEAEAQS